jgi:hypothetical protein
MVFKLEIMTYELGRTKMANITTRAVTGTFMREEPPAADFVDPSYTALEFEAV